MKPSNTIFLDSLLQKNQFSPEEAQKLTAAGKDLIKSITDLFSSSPITENSIIATTSILCAGSSTFKSLPANPTVIDSISNSSRLVVSSLIEINSSPKVFQGIVQVCIN